MKKNILILFVLSWVLTLGGNDILLDWIGEIIIGVGVSPQASFLPVVGLSLQILFSILAAVLAYFTLSDKSLRPMSLVVVGVNGLKVVNALAAFVYAVVSGAFTF
jgi:hypothetical protein